MGLARDLCYAVFPEATRRFLTSRAMRKYEAANFDNFRPALQNMTSGDGAMSQAGDKLRQIARHLDENHDLVVGVFNDLVNNVVGTGIKIAPMVRTRDGKLHTEANKIIAEAVDDWGQYPDVTGQYGLEEMERQAARSLFRDGEIFIQPINNQRFSYRSDIRFALEFLEADYVPFEYYDAGLNVAQGIALNEWNAPAAYYVLKKHPGDIVYSSLTSADLKKVPASRMLHLKHTRRFNQRRGVPVIHAVINRLRDIKDYEESERIAAKVAADMTGFIKRNAGMGAPVVNSSDDRITQMQAGMIFHLQEGEDVGTIGHDRPNTGLEAFRNGMMRAVAAGTGTRFSSISKDYNGTYSAQRQELVEGAIAYRTHWSYLVRRFYRPMYADHLVAAIVGSGRLNKHLASIDPASLRRADFRAPALPWIDPKKEADAFKVLLDAKLESHAEIIRSRGRDPLKVREELEEEQSASVWASAVDTAVQAIDEEVEDDDEGKTGTNG